MTVSNLYYLVCSSGSRVLFWSGLSSHHGFWSSDFSLRKTYTAASAHSIASRLQYKYGCTVSIIPNPSI